MLKLISYPLTVIYYFVFGLLLVIFHPIQWFCLNVFGYQAHKKSVDYLNLGLTRCLLILGNWVSFRNTQETPADKPTIIVANHQSMYDIPPIIWHMRKYHPKFISKKELGKGIPSVSYNLRHGGSVLINRRNSDQALREIKKIAAYANQHRRSVVIFPEGTRSSEGRMKKFKRSGLKTLIEDMPEARIIPISINNSWKTVRYGAFPMGVGNHITFDVHPSVEVSSTDTETLIDQIEETIISRIGNNE
ncbi:1-acyl-sn-glycerol-3-phosphate acyltransferase [Robertkochia marina]|uniref:1-acyl-sn-glycerol-3-phosphate acyltransferase n=1 Tax=Robertkochia marina TaxID=1227945 RepID=A0A4S3M3G3_9FLAO|nr:lysophospholipid acyltransferase family protein [Robertkochia marina]THD69430.1 1-acyl-sn-glycerol-3-phosphate acyltransferase [Robertkochia marina]TRZ47308.1 1-acyl-sn-glycerol-3-phosphate acyltransferase [Robertkochia marina]